MFLLSQTLPVWGLQAWLWMHRLYWAAEGERTLFTMQRSPSTLRSRLIQSATGADLARDPSTALRRLRTTEREVLRGLMP